MGGEKAPFTGRKAQHQLDKMVCLWCVFHTVMEKIKFPSGCEHLAMPMYWFTCELIHPVLFFICVHREKKITPIVTVTLLDWKMCRKYTQVKKNKIKNGVRGLKIKQERKIYRIKRAGFELQYIYVLSLHLRRAVYFTVYCLVPGRS